MMNQLRILKNLFTKRERSLSEGTILPSALNLDNKSLPLSAVHLGAKVIKESKDPTPELTTYNIKLGWIQGVLIPCLLNIWGVMLFLRIAWVVAQAGLGLTIVIIVLSSIVCIVTTLSLSAICTNGQVQGGGVYYLVSRSLGAELGASVGIIFAFANAVAASMNTIGFCESLNDLLKNHGLKIIDNSANDIRIVGAVTLLVMCLICAVGMDWETKTQNGLIVTIITAIIAYIIGSCMGPINNLERAKGFVGPNYEIASKNWFPDFRKSEGEHHDFFSVFSIFFPALTGVQAGANICGDLKDPASAIPKGTLIALAVSISSYFIMACLCGVGTLRDASGNVADLSNNMVSACKPNCKYGSHNNYEIMIIMALWGPFVYAGCWAATLSTALTNILSVPRLIQALGKDRIYPGLIYFSKSFGRHGEPYRGYVLVFIVSLTFLLIADLNTIAPLITNFYLASYSLINFCVFHAGIVSHISWRPTFQFYNKWLSLLGFLMCLMMMIIISWVMALVTVLIFLTLYLLVVYRKPDAAWGSSTEAQKYKETASYLLESSFRPASTKSYNPQLLVLAGTPYTRRAIVDMAHLITKLGSFMIIGDILPQLGSKERLTYYHQGQDWLHSHKYRGFYVILDGVSFEQGAKALMQVTGLGRYKPNILHIGLMTDWKIRPIEDVETYVRIIQHAFELQLAVMIQRMPVARRPLRSRTPPSQARSEGEMRVHKQMLAVLNADSDLTLGEDEDADDDEIEDRPSFPAIEEPTEQTKIQTPGPSNFDSSSKIRSSTTYVPLSLETQCNLDAWWLYDDGGLIVLLAYILSQRDFKTKMLRIFTLGRRNHEPYLSYQYMEALLARFRIEYKELKILQDLSEPPAEATWALFNNFIQKFRNGENEGVAITDEELRKLHTKTSRYLRLQELLQIYSADSALVVVTLPRPRKISTPLYMAWLDVISHDMPPLLFVRGNDTTVLCS